MTQQCYNVFPYYCACMIYGMDYDISGRYCKDCGGVIKRGLPSYAEYLRESAERRWWEGQL